MAEEGWLAYGLGPAFYLTSTTVDMSAAPNVTPGLTRLAQVPMGPALTSHYASLGPEKDFANIKLLSAGLGSAEWTTREYATTELARLGRQYPDEVGTAIAPLLKSADPELRSRAAYLNRKLPSDLQAQAFRPERARPEWQAERLRRALDRKDIFRGR